MADTVSTSATIDYSDQSGNKGQKSLTDINPNATNQQIRALAVAMNDLTTNTLTGVNKITKTKISSVAKTETTIALSTGETDTLSAATIINENFGVVNYDCNNHTGFVVVTYNDTVFPIIVARNSDTDFSSVGIYIAKFDNDIIDTLINPSKKYFVNGDTSKHFSKTGTIKFYVEETDTHTRSAEMTITINA